MAHEPPGLPPVLVDMYHAADLHRTASVKDFDKGGADLAVILANLENLSFEQFMRLPRIIFDGLTPEARALALQAEQAMIRLTRDHLLRRGSEGIIWIDKYVPHFHALGLETMQVELSIAQRAKLLNSGRFAALIKNFTDVDEGVIGFGVDAVKESYGFHGRNLGQFFRNQFEQAAIDRIPLLGTGDTLETRLFRATTTVDGTRVRRIQDLTITDVNGNTRRIKSETRARAIARTEGNRIRNQAYASKVDEVYGLDVRWVVLNPNPVSPECQRAVRAGIVTRDQLLALGRSPRHPNCKSQDMAYFGPWFQ